MDGRTPFRATVQKFLVSDDWPVNTQQTLWFPFSKWSRRSARRRRKVRPRRCRRSARRLCRWQRRGRGGGGKARAMGAGAWGRGGGVGGRAGSTLPVGFGGGTVRAGGDLEEVWWMLGRASSSNSGGRYTKSSPNFSLKEVDCVSLPALISTYWAIFHYEMLLNPCS